MMILIASTLSILMPCWEIFYIWGVIMISLMLKLKNLGAVAFTMEANSMADTFSIIMLILSYATCALAWMSVTTSLDSPSRHYTLIWFLLITLLGAFISKAPLMFYFWFEFSVIPIFFLILGWGYQPERVFAAKSMFLYTIFASLPLLIVILGYLASHYASFLQMATLSQDPKSWQVVFFLFFFLSFLVKFPMYSFHLWLPKAHVEAPLSGSMILAGILLKLGGFGAFRLMPLMPAIGTIMFWIMAFATIGGALISLVCVTQNDIKVLIAYSSVSHMSLSVAGILSQTKMLTSAALSMLVCHGVTSAAMFMGAGMIYLRTSSRNTLLMKGLLTLMPKMTLFWALICVSNMAGPPFVNLFTEMLIFLGLCSLSFKLAPALAGMAFFSAAYSLILYTAPTHGKVKSSFFTVSDISPLETSLLWIFSTLAGILTLFVFPIFSLI